MPKLTVILASVREGRAGEAIAQWFVTRAKEHGKFDVQLADLKELNLPILDEPHHPRFKKYVHDSTKAWSAIVDASDAFVFVTPEYNYTLPPALVNALDTVYHEWTYKPVGFVSYGGVSGGMRAVQTRQFRQEDDPDVVPDSVIRSLGELPAVLSEWNGEG